MKTAALFVLTALSVADASKRPILRKPFTNAPVDPAQAPIMNAAPSPSGNPSNPSSNTASSSQHTLSDVLPLHKQISIFASFTRDIDTISSRLDTPDLNTTVLAPVNSAISSLPRKPWEDPRDYAAMGSEAYDGQGGEERAHRNLRRFVEAHVLPLSPWEEGVKVKSLGGGEVWFEEKDGTRKVMPGGVEVVEVGRTVGNGEVWVLKGTLNYA